MLERTGCMHRLIAGFAKLWCRAMAFSLIVLPMIVGHVHAAPKPGELVIVTPAESPDLDPGNFDYRFTGQIIRHNVIETLANFNLKANKLVPRLALSWDQIDSRTLRVKLRRGVKFHDGSDFNADAVIYSMQRLFNNKISSLVRSKYFNQIKVETTKIDGHTVEFKTSEPDPLMPSRLAQVPMVSPKTPMNELIRNPAGTGPYRLAKWDAGVQIVLEQFKDYWGKKPQVTKATFVWRPEGSIRANMIAVGEADLAFSIPRQLATNKNTDVAYPNFDTLYYIIGAWKPPLDDIRVRKAMNLAVDRQALLGTVLPKEAVLATALVAPGISGHNPNLKPHPYDPVQARKLLAEARAAGVKVDTEIQIIGINSNFPSSNEVQEVVANMLQAVGLKVKVKFVESGLFRKYRDKPRIDDRPVLLQAQHDNDTGDAGVSLARHLCQSVRNPICDPKLDAMISKGLAAEGKAREKIWQDVIRYMHEEVQVDLLLVHQVAFARIGERIKYDVTGRSESNFFIEDVLFRK